MKVIHFLLLVLIALTACSSGYHRKGLLFSSGFSETQLGANVFQISFEGSDRHNTEEVSDLNLLRSAEVTLKHGFNYFVILQTSGSGENQIFNDAPVVSTTSKGLTRSHASTSTILCSAEKPDISHGQVYEAAAVVSSIKQKYGM